MFQSTHPHGVRLKQGQLTEEQAKFQSTHPHGVRLHNAAFFLQNVVFQSTHPHGVRPKYVVKYARIYFVSIHAPTRGATLIFLITKYYKIMFQSTHPHGVRHTFARGRQTEQSFQSTHPHGVRHHDNILTYLYNFCFNPRTHTGCDFKHGILVTSIFSFNPRTHTGCDKRLET